MKNLRTIRVRADEHAKLLRKSLDISSIEGKKISIPETVRRILNVPNIDNILQTDAQIKRRRIF